MENRPLNVKAEDLKVISETDAKDIVNEFERLAKEANFQPASE